MDRIKENVANAVTITLFLVQDQTRTVVFMEPV